MAFIQAIIPFIGFCFISLVVYSQLKSPYNIIVALIVLFTGTYLSYMVFDLMKRRGVIEVLAGGSAAYELDELEPTIEDGVQKLSPEELTAKYNSDQLDFIAGSISIWGDRAGRRLNDRHKIDSIKYDSVKQILVFTFQTNCVLKIKKPRLILICTDYLKIVTATEILWQIPDASNSNKQYSYLNTGKAIKTKSNANWKPNKNDMGLGMNAVYIQG